MTSRDFCFWLMGSLELNGNKGFDKNQTKMLKDHLNMCFIHMVNDDGTLKPEKPEKTKVQSGLGYDTKVNC